jgi:hypothetical protein
MYVYVNLAQPHVDQGHAYLPLTMTLRRRGRYSQRKKYHLKSENYVQYIILHTFAVNNLNHIN